MSLSELPLTFRALFSAFLIVLGVGYLTALTLLFLVEVQPGKEQGLSLAQAIERTYHGKPKVSRLESALMGPMSGMLSKLDRERILDWVHAGGRADEYPEVRPILQRQCLSCHSPASGMSIPPLTDYTEISKFLKTDVGMTSAQLARVSHVHLLSISIIFLVTGAIFALAELPVGLKVFLVVAPYASIVMDIGSWWGTKYLSPVFAYIVIAGGALMGVSLALQIAVSLWQMWAGPVKGALEPIIGRYRVARQQSA